MLWMRFYSLSSHDKIWSKKYKPTGHKYRCIVLINSHENRIYFVEHGSFCFILIVLLVLGGLFFYLSPILFRVDSLPPRQSQSWRFWVKLTGTKTCKPITYLCRRASKVGHHYIYIHYVYYIYLNNTRVYMLVCPCWLIKLILTRQNIYLFTSPLNNVAAKRLYKFKYIVLVNQTPVTAKS